MTEKMEKNPQNHLYYSRAYQRPSEPDSCRKVTEGSAKTADNRTSAITNIENVEGGLSDVRASLCYVR